MSGISTHILDISLGRPAAHVNVTLELSDGDGWLQLSRQTADDEGRVKQLLPSSIPLALGTYRLTFFPKEYFDTLGVRGLYPLVQVTFSVTNCADHYHIPLLLTANGYSTYRGN